MAAFSDLTSQQRRGVIIHHWDTDGLASAAVLLCYFSKQFPRKKIDLFVPLITNYYLTEEQYQYLQNQEYQFVVTCDINFQADTINRLTKLWPKQVYVFDHHQQTPFSNVHYYNQVMPACAVVITKELQQSNNLLSALALVGDKEEAIQQDKVYYPPVQEMLREHNLTFSDLLLLRRLIDSNYIMDDYSGMSETVHLLQHDPLAILTDVRLQSNLELIEHTMQELMQQPPERFSDLVYHLNITTTLNILSQVTRNLSRQYADKIIFTTQTKGDQLTCYVRRKNLSYDMRKVIQFARELGLNSGGKGDVAGIIIPQASIATILPKIHNYLTSISI